ncbi:MAG: hypothetical protein R3220_06815 [Balneolaceae bacterium]|nr:hypothetical protein [Balneolaceae bacterium]
MVFWKKAIQKYRTLFPSLLALFFVSVSLISCDNFSESVSTYAIELDDSKFQNSRVFDGRDSVATGIDGFTATQANFKTISEFVRIQEIIVDGSGEKFIDFVEITDPNKLDPSTFIYEGRENNPILDPNGEQVRWGEFSDADGAVIVKCTKPGTKITTHLNNLIPKGLYSIWVDIFEAGTNNRIERISYADNDKGGRPPEDGLRNVFHASAHGEGHIAGFISPKKFNGVEISSCMLSDIESDEYDWRVIGIYHIDGTAGINEINDAGTFVEQTGLIFETESLPDIE